MRKLRLPATWWTYLKYSTEEIPPHFVPLYSKATAVASAFWEPIIKHTRSAANTRYFNNMHKHYQAGMGNLWKKEECD